MFDAVVATLPEQVQWVALLISWIPDAQASLVSLVWFLGSGFGTLLSRVLLLLPALLVIVAIWCTMLALYTVPFRSHRREFLTALVMLWWEVGRSIWLFWVGFVRFLWMLVGWAWGLLKLSISLSVKAIRYVFLTPFAFMDWLGRKYFKPGVPWFAFLLTIAWCALESLIFTYALLPLVTEVFYDLSGVEARNAIASILFFFLFAVITGSYAMVQALSDAMAQKDYKALIQLTIVEISVMFFEVIFLYRELIDALTPWIAASTGVRLGFLSTLAFASIGWIGIRAMTWFFFARYGTPALLAIVARQTLAVETAPEEIRPQAPEPDWWRGPIIALKAEHEWFRASAHEILELLSLPVLQLLATAVNCATTVITSRAAFKLPFTKLDEVMMQDALAQVLRGRRPPASGIE